ncbi:MAG: transglycosylase SLT domain-containing protein [Rickettsiella sp.]|nr:transglycosylase SLT domain-containing protein [Rickettsiella sp.]
MTYKTLKIYTLLLSLLLVLAIGITACVEFPPLGVTSTTDENGPDKAAQSFSTGGNLESRSAKALYSAVNKGTLWGPIRDHLQLTAAEENQPAVQEQIRWFVKNPAYLNDAVSRAAPYMYYIYTQVTKRNLPTELVLLPIIESGYNPSATNASSGAAGLWQLMSSTARARGVHQDKSFDGRRDLYSSTNAALDYLTYLKSFFGGDWLLAIAAYDTGEGNVQNAIRHNTQHDKNTHFWALPLAFETRSYIPRLLALAAIVKNPVKYGVDLPAISDKPYLELVDVGKKAISLTHAAKLANMNLSELKQLNPGVKNNSATLTQGQLTLPIDRVALYRKHLAALSSNGSVLKQSKKGSVQLVSNQSTIETKDKNADTSTQVHLVKRGDTLTGIAKQYHVSVKKLKQWNQLATDQLKPGEKLRIMLS